MSVQLDYQWSGVGMSPKSRKMSKHFSISGSGLFYDIIHVSKYPTRLYVS